LGLPPERYRLMPIGEFLDLWACYKQFHGMEKPAHDDTADLLALFGEV
jgi:hypothetical protein